jgi:hypothetical protein
MAKIHHQSPAEAGNEPRHSKIAPPPLRQGLLCRDEVQTSLCRSFLGLKKVLASSGGADPERSFEADGGRERLASPCSRPGRGTGRTRHRAFSASTIVTILGRLNLVGGRCRSNTVTGTNSILRPPSTSVPGLFTLSTNVGAKSCIIVKLG